MKETVQPGTAIDRELWRRFREEVGERRGGVRGHLRHELENALRDYIHADEATPTELNKRLQRIESAVGVTACDGGVDSLAGSHTHTHTETGNNSDEITEKPHPKAPSDEKVAWLGKVILSQERPNGGDLHQVPRSTIRDVVKSEYSFRGDTAKRYVDRLIDHFELVPHPRASNILVTEDEREELVRERMEDDSDA